MSEEEFGNFDYEPEEEVKPKFVTTAKKFIRHKKMSEEEFGNFDYEPEEEVKPKFVTTAKKFIRHRELTEEQKEANDLKNGRYFKDVNREVRQIKDYDQFARNILLDRFGVSKELLEKEKCLKEQNLEIPEDLQEQLNVARENEEYIKKRIDRHNKYDTTSIDALLYNCGIEVSQDHKTWTCTLRESYGWKERERKDTAELNAKESMLTKEGVSKYGRYMDNCLVIKEIKMKLAKIKTLEIVTTDDVDKAVTALQKLESLREMEPEHGYPIGTYVYDIIQEKWKQELYESLFGGIETFDTTKSQIEVEEYQNEIEILKIATNCLGIKIDEGTIIHILQLFDISKYDEDYNFFDEFAYIIGVIINLQNLIKLGHTITFDDFNKCLDGIKFTISYLRDKIREKVGTLGMVMMLKKMHK